MAKSLWRQNVVMFLASQIAPFPSRPRLLRIHPADSCAGNGNTSSNEAERDSACKSVPVVKCSFESQYN